MRVYSVKYTQERNVTKYDYGKFVPLKSKEMENRNRKSKIRRSIKLKVPERNIKDKNSHQERQNVYFKVGTKTCPLVIFVIITG